MESEYETIRINNKEQFEKMASEMLKNWKEYKKMDTRMKLLDASTKKYMIDNDMKIHECNEGALMIVEQNRRILDRTLIDDIYKIDSKVNICFKSPK